MTRLGESRKYQTQLTKATRPFILTHLPSPSKNLPPFLNRMQRIIDHIPPKRRPSPKHSRLPKPRHHALGPLVMFRVLRMRRVVGVLGLLRDGGGVVAGGLGVFGVGVGGGGAVGLL